MKVAQWLGCLVAAGWMTGCGYALVGSGNSLDPKIKTIEVPAFVNKTTRVELEQRVTQAVADEFVSRGRLKLVTVPSSADAILRGSIDSFGIFPIAFELPASGQLFNFGQIMVVGEDPQVTLFFLHARILQALALSVLLAAGYCLLKLNLLEGIRGRIKLAIQSI